MARVDASVEDGDDDLVAALGERAGRVDLQRFELSGLARLRAIDPARVRLRVEGLGAVVREADRLLPADDAVGARLDDRGVLAQLLEDALGARRVKPVGRRARD